MNSIPELKLDWCSYAAALYACKRWHYSKAIPTPPYNLVGVWEDKAFIGCVIFSRGANMNLSKQFGVAPTEVCELTRIALTKHYHPVSRIIRIAVTFLRRQSPGLRLIISFADQNQNHHGGIYQAAGWIYTGETQHSYRFIDHYGRKWHPRQVSAIGMKPQYGVLRYAPRTDECTRVDELPKHRYVLPLTKELRAKIEPLARAYPKRKITNCVSSETSDTTADQAEKSGATPTDTLQQGSSSWA